MPAFKRRFRRRARKAGRRMRRNPRVTRSRMFNPNPVFTETYAKTTIPVVQGGVPGAIFFNIDEVAQLSQYSNLYRKYRILRAKVMLMPEFAHFDQNQAENNSALTRTYYGQARIAYAINDSPDLQPPTSELDVLKDNGCKIRHVSSKLNITCRPVPDTKDANGNQMTFRGKYLNFQSTNIDHYGISFWINQLISNNTGAVANNWVVYVKLTFQLSDPR